MSERQFWDVKFYLGSSVSLLVEEIPADDTDRAVSEARRRILAWLPESAPYLTAADIEAREA